MKLILEDWRDFLKRSNDPHRPPPPSSLVKHIMSQTGFSRDKAETWAQKDADLEEPGIDSGDLSRDQEENPEDMKTAALSQADSNAAIATDEPGQREPWEGIEENAERLDILSNHIAKLAAAAGIDL